MTDSKELEKFRQINAVAQIGEIVFVGSDFFASLPIGELAASFKLDEKVYNRSIKGLMVFDMGGLLKECVLDLRPSKVFFNFGEREAESGIGVEDFIAAYEWMLYTVHGNCSALIYVVSIEERSEMHIKYNNALRALCDETGCKFVDISAAFGGVKSELKVFNALKLHVMTNFDFAELMTVL